MKKPLFLLLIIFLPIALQALENQVPIGTTGNRLVFTVKNPSSVPILKPSVTIASAPNWIEFKDITSAVDSIPANGARDFEFTFSVFGGEAGKTGSIRLNVLDETGRVLSRGDISLKTVLASDRIAISPPFPNPANPNCTIRFALPEAGRVRLQIFNSLGQSVRTLLDGYKPSGLWDYAWDGRDPMGMEAASGVYVARLETVIRGRTTRLSSKILMQR